jgi:hypothetical protein
MVGLTACGATRLLTPCWALLAVMMLMMMIMLTAPRDPDVSAPPDDRRHDGWACGMSSRGWPKGRFWALLTVGRFHELASAAYINGQCPAVGEGWGGAGMTACLRVA